ncbi:pantoate--beta-alanine ligase [Metabacillus herbersteinensis]|uniref:Pantothenate synthetase n=1 Tax=Metabacillus herbersteinensis TaxID=283816 RepID=A0ABV6GFE0_9BACI
MKIVTTVFQLKQEISQHQAGDKTIGFVPTMGFLHEGHLKLLAQARAENEIVVLSIFVNPLQFGPNEDFDSYPRNLEKDKELARLAKVDLIFAPSAEEMYQGEPSYTVRVHDRINVLCGKTRVGHFDGVATVLTKLFHLVQPTSAYFGMKDAQQVAVVHGLVEQFHFPLKIVPVDTIREEDGLAKSSRNVYLTSSERSQAPAIYKGLLIGKELVLQGERTKQKIVDEVSSYIMQHTSGKIDYVEVLSYPELINHEVISGKLIIAVALKFTKVRLIDNITIDI